MIMPIVGTPIVASGARLGGLMILSTSKRKKKYHSGRGTYVVVVGFALDPSSAPSPRDIVMITAITTQAIASSFSRLFIAGTSCPAARGLAGGGASALYLCLVQLCVLVGFQPRGRGGAQLRHEIQVGPDQRDDQRGYEQHVDRIEARKRGGAEFAASAQEVAEVRSHQRPGAVDVHAHDRR